jgi:hypothetical protein
MGTYNFYIFSRLILDAGLVDDKLEYDKSYDEIVDLYHSFEDSIFDDGIVDLYQCILNFIEWKSHN